MHGKQMNILFIGPYRQHDGWGSAAKDYLEVLTQSKYNVSSAPVYLGGYNTIDFDLPTLESEKNKYPKYDIVIQNVLPDLFEKTDSYNIGIYYSETNNLNKSFYIEKINLLDELWVSTPSEKESLIKSGVKTKITVMPIPVDTNKLEQFEDIERLEIPELQEGYVFYVVAEFVERKNIEAAIIAFNREFVGDYGVKFLIKTSGNDSEIKSNILDIKRKTRLFHNLSLYKNEIIITSRLTDLQMASLHKTGDCLLVTSRGESYCRPVMDAIYYGNEVICTENIHTCSLLENNYIPVKSIETIPFINNPPLPHIYTGWETWYEISILDLQKKMREAFNNARPKVPKKEWINKFSYSNMKDRIEKHVDNLKLNT